MRKVFSISLLGLVLVCSKGVSNAQTKPKLYPPLDIPLILSGNFGEIRTNHFHSGLDFKTQGREGLKVYAAMGGYVSRIKVSAYGYGKALYIAHPDGYTTVYAHLSGYYTELDDWIKSEQYRLQKFEVDLYPEKNQFPVNKGQVVGYSGNSGGSGSPHLHFEVRDSASELALNVLEFGLEITDTRSPDIKGIKVYCMSDSTMIEGLDKDLYIPVEKAGAAYKLKHAGPVKISGPVAFGIHTTDRLDAAENVCGIFRVELTKDGEIIFSQKIDRVNFNLKRHMNAHVDYREQRKNNRDIHRSFIRPGNKLPIYTGVKNRGVVQLIGEEKAVFRFRVWDVAGNESELLFETANEPGKKMQPHSHLSTYREGAVSAPFSWKQENQWKTENCSVSIPKGALFDDIIFTYRESTAQNGALTPTHEIGDTYEPLSEDFTVRIRIPEKNEGEKSKLIIVRHDPHNGKQTAIKSTVKDGFLEAESSYFGWFFIAEDKTKPSIRSVDFSQNMRGKKSFSFKISDDLSGISSYNFFIDGKWALVDHDAKNSMFTHTFNEKYLTKGSHKLRIVVTDVSGNKAEYSSDFEW